MEQLVSAVRARGLTQWLTHSSQQLWCCVRDSDEYVVTCVHNKFILLDRRDGYWNLSLISALYCEKHGVAARFKAFVEGPGKGACELLRLRSASPSPDSSSSTSFASSSSSAASHVSRIQSEGGMRCTWVHPTAAIVLLARHEPDLAAAFCECLRGHAAGSQQHVMEACSNAMATGNMATGNMATGNMPQPFQRGDEVVSALQRRVQSLELKMADMRNWRNEPTKCLWSTWRRQEARLAKRRIIHVSDSEDSDEEDNTIVNSAEAGTQTVESEEYEFDEDDGNEAPKEKEDDGDDDDGDGDDDDDGESKYVDEE